MAQVLKREISASVMEFGIDICKKIFASRKEIVRHRRVPG